MPALNYKKEFAALVESGKKRQTIRALRKDGRDPKPGDTLHHYTGMRTRACRKLLESSCRSVHPVTIFGVADLTEITVDGILLSGAEVRRLAIADGFDTAHAFLQFFRDNHGLPFHGRMIKW